MKARGRVLRGAKKQQGFAAIEMIVVLILVISALGIGAQAMFDHADNMAAQTTADHQKIISDAAAAYIKDNYAAVVCGCRADYAGDDYHDDVEEHRVPGDERRRPEQLRPGLQGTGDRADAE
ncbi:type II secretion system protein [Pseudomonas aeruginosa]